MLALESSFLYDIEVASKVKKTAIPAIYMNGLFGVRTKNIGPIGSSILLMIILLPVALSIIFSSALSPVLCELFRNFADDGQ